jgi:hypothetical protein
MKRLVIFFVTVALFLSINGSANTIEPSHLWDSSFLVATSDSAKKVRKEMGKHERWSRNYDNADKTDSSSADISEKSNELITQKDVVEIIVKRILKEIEKNSFVKLSVVYDKEKTKISFRHKNYFLVIDNVYIAEVWSSYEKISPEMHYYNVEIMEDTSFDRKRGGMIETLINIEDINQYTSESLYEALQKLFLTGTDYIERQGNQEIQGRLKSIEEKVFVFD